MPPEARRRRTEWDDDGFASILSVILVNTVIGMLLTKSHTETAFIISGNSTAGSG